jgi:hypothetical protein
MQTILAIKTSDILSHVRHSLLAAGFRVCDFDRVNVTAPPLRESATAIVIRFQDEPTSAENTCFEIRKSDPQIPIMIISPRAEPSTKVRLLELVPTITWANRLTWRNWLRDCGRSFARGILGRIPSGRDLISILQWLLTSGKVHSMFEPNQDCC